MKNLKFIFILPPTLIVVLFIYFYLNPSIDNEDFHLEYLSSNPNKDFYKERNFNIRKEKYTHNNEIYSNVPEGYKITIHSIDFTEYGERILIITDYFNKNERFANLTYRHKNGIYTPTEITKRIDSVFIYQILETTDIHKHLLFKGNRIKDAQDN